MSKRTILRPNVTDAQRRLLVRARNSADLYQREQIGTGRVYVDGPEKITARRLETFGELRRPNGGQSYEITDVGRERVPADLVKGKKARDPLAGIPPELQAKMRDPAWREAFNAPLTPERAAKVMPPVDVLALMLARWMNVSPTTRQWFVGVNRRCSAINEKHDYARAEGAAADLLEALETVIAAGTAQPGDGVKDGAR